jgi:hypothetical protein
MKKIHALCDYSKYRENDLIAEGSKVVKKSTGNPHAAGSVPSVTEIDNATHDFENSCAAAASGSVQSTIIKNLAKETLVKKLGAFAKHIDKVADGDIEIIAGCGLNASRQWTRRKKEDLSLKRSEVPGQIIAACRRWPKAGAYVWQIYYGENQPENDEDWSIKTVTLQTKAVLSNLKQGNLLVRYCAVERDGMQTWSEHRHIFVL